MLLSAMAGSCVTFTHGVARAQATGQPRENSRAFTHLQESDAGFNGCPVRAMHEIGTMHPRVCSPLPLPHGLCRLTLAPLSCVRLRGPAAGRGFGLAHYNLYPLVPHAIGVPDAPGHHNHNWYACHRESVVAEDLFMQEVDRWLASASPLKSLTSITNSSSPCTDWPPSPAAAGDGARVDTGELPRGRGARREHAAPAGLGWRRPLPVAAPLPPVGTELLRLQRGRQPAGARARRERPLPAAVRSSSGRPVPKHEPALRRHHVRGDGASPPLTYAYLFGPAQLLPLNCSLNPESINVNPVRGVRTRP